MEDIVGKQIGIFDVLYECNFKSNDGHRMFHVKCSKCGWETDMKKAHIARPKVCQHKSYREKYINWTLWKNKTLQHIFNGIKRRCYNPNDRAYRWYGAKGIKICEEWLENPKKFEEWALGNGYENGLTIDRKDENKDYCPENCRWITMENNLKYKSTTHLIEVDGEVHTGKDWSKILNLGPNTINMYFRNYSDEQVKEFIRRRKRDKNKIRKSHQTWLETYNVI